MTDWTGPEQIALKLRQRWQRGEFLAGLVRAEASFPLELALHGPSPREVAERFGDVQAWVDSLRRGSRETRGRGYALRWQRTGNRVQGANELPVAACIDTPADAWFLLGEQTAVRRFEALVGETRARHPALLDWLAGHGTQALELAGDWSRILDVVDYFVAHPRPGLYLRQLDIPTVDTKFIESRRAVLAELLDQVLPAEQIDASAAGARQFARRYGLRTAPTLVRFRWLDASQRLQGLTDLSVPAEDFARLDPPVERVFITENLTNGLAMPECPSSLVVFGLGYGLERLAQAPWLARCAVWYWGDIDTHGFGILDRLRSVLPHARSLLMDQETLLAHRAFWGQEPQANRFTGDAPHLTAAERSLLDDLRADRLGERVRLEQERVAYRAVEDAVRAVSIG